MKILYLTNSMLPDDFDDLNAKVLVKANPSNQNFHHRLIRAFGQKYAVTVICYRPLATYGQPASLKYEWKKTRKVSYHYIKLTNRPYIKQHKFVEDALKLIGKLLAKTPGDKPLIVVDAINATLRRLAHKTAKKFRLKTLAIVTDNPRLLSGAIERSATAAINDLQTFDYYMPLTPSLDILVNPLHKPHFNLPGIAEERRSYSRHTRPYMFFAGALHERYGINNLVTAFMTMSHDVDLIIAGHGPDHFVKHAELRDPRIKFVGQLSQSDTYKYEAGALLNINPRPFDLELNRYSVPSKFFEYMTSGAPTMSTEHEFLTPKYDNDAIWTGRGTVPELKSGLLQFMEMTAATKDRLAKKAKETVLGEYGIDAVAVAINHFVNSLK